MCACTNLESFSASICGLQRLRKLTLEGSFPEVPKDLYQLESLQELTLSMKEIKHLPDTICMLKHLKYLNLRSCWLLEQLPINLGQLECLEMLILTDCLSLQDIPNNICQIRSLEYLHIPYCILVDKLPEELGRLECLKELNIEGAGISRLPQSIFELKGLRIIGTRWRLESHDFKELLTGYKSRFTIKY
ncbi:putative leucine-rich repeat domain superfamily [Helianthus anomalus]